MKKMLVFILIIGILFCLNFFNEHSLQEIFYDNIVSYYAFVNTTNNLPQIKDVNVIKNGNGAILKTSNKNALKKISNISNLSGECVELKNINLIKIKRKLNLILLDEDNVNNSKVITGYSNLLPSFLIDKNKKINVQIAISMDKILIGYPLILQGF